MTVPKPVILGGKSLNTGGVLGTSDTHTLCDLDIFYTLKTIGSELKA